MAKASGGKLAQKLVNRLSRRNYRSAALIRFHPEFGFFRVEVVGLRYFDRGAGSFMGPGGWVYEGRVVCRSYPDEPPPEYSRPAILSKAGWGFEGEVSGPDGNAIQFADGVSTKSAVAALDREFWDIDQALAYANGVDDGDLAQCSKPMRVRRLSNGYRLERLE